jgi:hypothetical protein
MIRPASRDKQPETTSATSAQVLGPPPERCPACGRSYAPFSLPASAALDWCAVLHDCLVQAHQALHNTVAAIEEEALS